MIEHPNQPHPITAKLVPKHHYQDHIASAKNLKWLQAVDLFAKAGL
jgi:hypothetical protein